jgi:hypothetical protein
MIGDLLDLQTFVVGEHEEHADLST